MLFRKRADWANTRRWDLTDTSITGGGSIGNPGSSYALAPGPPAASGAARADPGVPARPAARWRRGRRQRRDLRRRHARQSAPGYTALAVGDFNGDGQSDMLFESTAASMRPGRPTGRADHRRRPLGSPGRNLRITRARRLQRRRAKRHLFKDATGDYATWDMSGTRHHRRRRTSAIPARGFTYAGTGDFTGDGTSDHPAEGRRAAITGSRASQNDASSAASEVGSPGAGWKLAAIGDLNGDGKADLLFSNGRRAVRPGTSAALAIVGGGAIGNPGARLDRRGDR